MTDMPVSLPRRTLLAAFAAALAAARATEAVAAPVEPAPGVADAGRRYAKWFALAPGTERQWQVTEVGTDDYRALVRPRAPSKGGLLRVLVLYPRQSTAYDVAMSKVLDVFRAKDVAAEFAVINFRNDEQRGQFAIGVAATGKFDLILSMGSESTAWLWANYRNGRIPVVTLCSKDPVILGQVGGYDQGSNSNFAFTSLNIPIDVQMAYVTQLRPNLRNLAIVVDSNNVSAVETQAKPIRQYAEARGTRVLEVAVNDPATVRTELERSVEQTIAQMAKNDPTLDNSLFYITGSTIVFGEMATINARSSRVPILSAVPEVVRAGDDSATLSIGVSFESNAHLAAIYAVEIMNGHARAGDLRVGVVSPPDIAISFRKARDIGMHVPFGIFESANNVFDYDGRLVRSDVVVELAR